MPGRPSRARRAAVTGTARSAFRGRLVVLWHRSRRVLGAWLTFIALLAGFSWLVQWAPAGILIRRYSVPWTAHLTAWTLRLLGAEGQTDGRYIYSTVSDFRVIDECTAVYPMAIFCAAVLAYPGRLLAKVLGIALGVPAIVLINQVRLVSLCYVEYWKPDLLDLAHFVIWQCLLALFIVLLWVWWVAGFASGQSRGSA